MDLESLFPLLMIGLYLLFRLIGGRRQAPPRQRPAPPAEQEQRAPGGSASELEVALREIREALRGEAPRPSPPPLPARVPAPPAPAPQQPVYRGAPLPPVQQHEGPHRPAALPAVDPLPDVAALPDPAVRPTGRSAGLRRRLRTPATARDAMLLQEILGPPLSKRPPRG